MRTNRRKKLIEKSKSNGVHLLSKKIKKELRNADHAQIHADRIARETIKNYAKDLNDKGGNFGISIHHQTNRCPILVLQESCRMTNEQVKTVIRSSLIERGTFFNVRNPRHLGLSDNDSYKIRLGTVDGPIILLLVRNAFSTDVALKGSEIFEKVHNKRTEEGGGWVRGGEAAIRMKPNKIIAQTKDSNLMKKCGYTPNNIKEIMLVGPQNTEHPTQCKIVYENNFTGKGRSSKKKYIINQPRGKFIG